MYSSKQLANQGLGVYQIGMVDCEKCQTPIAIRQPNMVSLEFSVPCQKCGRRGIYYKRMIYFQDAAERRSRPRK